jgi:hypothetical protein
MTSRRRTTLVAFFAGGLALAMALAFFVSPRASSQPDGLERVATDEGFIDSAADSAVAGSPLADYAVSGVDDEGLSTAVAGVIGVGLTFAVGCGLLLLMRARRRRRAAPAAVW